MNYQDEPIYSYDPRQEELEIEYNSQFDYIHEVNFGMAEMGDDDNYEDEYEDIPLPPPYIMGNAGIEHVHCDCNPWMPF
jgi:hypothetical protein